MAINLSNSNIATRENRIGSITGYVGTLKDLAEKVNVEHLKVVHDVSHSQVHVYHHVDLVSSQLLEMLQ